MFSKNKKEESPQPNQWTLDGEDLAEELKYTFTTDCNDFNGDHDACFRLGEWHQVMKQNNEKALSIYGRNCSENTHAKSCFNKAAILLGANGGENSDTEAAELVNKACKLGHTQACDVSASLHMQGVGCIKDTHAAMAALEVACSQNFSPSCFRLGSYYLTAFKQIGAERSPEKARPYFEQACSYGHPTSCHTLAVMYKKGDGVPKNDKKFAYYADLTKDLVKATGERLGVKIANS